MKKVYLLVLIIGYITINLIYLDKYPLAYGDEAIFSEPGWIFLKEGRIVSKIYSGWLQIEKKFVVYGRTFYFLKALIFKIFGCGLLQARLLSFISGLLVIVLTYLISRSFFSKEIALLSGFMIAITEPIVRSSHDARPEIVILMCLLLSVWLFILGMKKDSAFYYFLSGLIAGFSIDIILYGIIVIFIILIMIFFSEKFSFQLFLKMMNVKNKWWTLLGLIIGLIWYVSVHILPDPNFFFFQLKEISMTAPKAQLPIFSFSIPQIIIQEATRYVRFFWGTKMHRNMFLLVIFTFSIGYTLRKMKNDPGIRFIYRCLVGAIVCQTFFFYNKSSLHIIFLLPFLTILVSVVAFSLKRLWLRQILIGSVTLFFTLQIVYIIVKFKDTNYFEWSRKIREYIPQESVVFGSAIHWAGLYDYELYVDGILLTLVSESERVKHSIGKTFAEVISNKKINYIILSNDLITWLSLQPEVLRNEVYNFIETHCELVGMVFDKHYSPAPWDKGFKQLFVTGEEYATRIYKVKNLSSVKHS